MVAKTDKPYSTKKLHRYYLQKGISLENVDDLLKKPGTILSEIQGRCVRQVDCFIVEDFSTSLSTSRIDREKGLRIWSSGCGLRDYGIPIIMPAA